MTKTNIGRGIFGLVAIFFMGSGVMLTLNPASVLDHFLLGSLETASELSAVRAFIGATVFATWVSVLIGAIKTNFNYILVGMINLSTVIFARLLGYFVDGTFPEFVPMIIPPIFFLGLMLIAYKLMVTSIDR